MDNLGFVKTLEAVLAGVIAMTLLSFVQSYTTSQIQSVSRSPNNIINDFLDVIDIRMIVEDYDYLKLDSLLHNMFFETVYYYFEPVYFEKLLVKSNVDKSWPNISFTYHFPIGIDENSIRILSGEYEYNVNANFNWHRVPVSFNETLKDINVEVNLSIDESSINNKSFRFFIGGKESELSLTNWNESPSRFNATVIVYVSELNVTEQGYIYFSKEGFSNISYPILNPTRSGIEPIVYNVEEARTADISFTPENLTTTERIFYLAYTLFSNNQNNYDSLTNINNTDVSISFENTELKQGTNPYTTTIRGQNAVNRVIPISNGYVELKIIGDFS